MLVALASIVVEPIAYKIVTNSNVRHLMYGPIEKIKIKRRIDHRLTIGLCAGAGTGAPNGEAFDEPKPPITGADAVENAFEPNID